MRLPPRLILALALAAPLTGLALSGCADAGPNAVAAAPAAPALPAGDANGSNYGLFLAGEAALQAGQSADAAQYFSRAAHGAGEASAPVQTLIREKAFTAAVMAGDIDQAAALAPATDPVDPTPSQRLGRLVRAVDALAEGRNKDADAVLTAPGAGVAFDSGFVLLRPWTAAAVGDTARATAALDRPAPALTRVSAEYSQALLLERAKRFDEAEMVYKTLTSSQFAPLYAIPYAEYLQRRGRPDDAAALYAAILKRMPNSRELKRASLRLDAKKSPIPTLMTLKQGAAHALTSAAEMALIEKRFVDGEIYLRLALRLDPQEDEAWVFLGDLLAQGEDPTEARAAYGHVPPTSPDYIDARERVIASYQAAGDLDTALRLIQDLAKTSSDDREVLIAEADLYRAANRYADAVAVLDKLIDADPAGADWALYYSRGASLDRIGRWAEAEKDLQKALALKPDQPDVLNYLGYSWVSRGEKLPQAMIMLQRAYLAQPDSGEIADSLGWAYYHVGDFKQAVQRLERAVSLEPVNPEINDHLGDAYWRAGRRTEAQYQWNKVLTMMPSGDLKSAVERKLAGGLDTVPADTARS